MSSRSFRSVFMVASCAGAALGCYMVSLRVASERAQLEGVENRIVLAQRDMRVLQTEIGTRGRLSQLERWNAGAFALAAPAADQFVRGGFELAKLTQPDRKVDFKASVYLASAPAPQRPAIGAPETDDSGSLTVTSGAGSLLHEASLKTETREVSAQTAAALPQAAAISTDKPATAARLASKLSVGSPSLAAAHHAKKGGAIAPTRSTSSKEAFHRDEPTSVHRSVGADLHASELKSAAKKTVDKPRVVSAKAVTKTVRMAKVDPLAPLPARHPGHSKDVSAD